MAGSLPDEDESVLDISQQTKRPLDFALRQQRIESWNPILDPVWVIGALFVLGIVFVPVGFHIKALSDDVVELKDTYDSYEFYNGDSGAKPCAIGNETNAGTDCTIQMTVPRDMEPPILIHYEIDNFYQNHKYYVDSRNDNQLLGSFERTKLTDEDCNPLNEINGVWLNPCGLIANTFFNDIISLEEGSAVSSDGNESLVMLETGIAWKSDLEFRFNQPDGFKYEECAACDNTCCNEDDDDDDDDGWPCNPEPDNKGEAYTFVDTDFKYTERTDASDEPTCYRYHYPKQLETQYLYETYDMVIDPIEGVTNEHFAVWMRPAALPKFRKLYGWIEQPIAAGTVLKFNIKANWVVASFEGSKTLIVSTNNAFGGKNDWFGLYFIAFGIFCLIVGCFFMAKHILKPRKIGDKKYLHYKKEL